MTVERICLRDGTLSRQAHQIDSTGEDPDLGSGIPSDVRHSDEDAPTRRSFLTRVVCVYTWRTFVVDDPLRCVANAQG